MGGGWRREKRDCPGENEGGKRERKNEGKCRLTDQSIRFRHFSSFFLPSSCLQLASFGLILGKKEGIIQEEEDRGESDISTLIL